MVNGGDKFADRTDQIMGITCRAQQQRFTKSGTLSIRKIGLINRLSVIRIGHPNVLGNTNYSVIKLLKAGDYAVERDLFANRVFIWKVMLRGRFIDDDYRLATNSVARIEISSC